MNVIKLGLVASAVSFGAAYAQTAVTPAPATPVAPPATVVVPAPAVPSTTVPSTAMPSTTVPAPVVAVPPATTMAPVAGAPRGGVVNRNSGPAAASGNSNQAVATTTANAPTPARGRNSFTRGEARRRLEGGGYAQVSGLAKDANGVWRGKGSKDGQQVSVWLDYKGNMGHR